ncbi:methyl-accepting chemotaxis protein [Paraburkholderia kururiensis]|uniref:methyl-accepting chemotaxis protein n=1 Tax=Paraburkholderia kururiensis TaxID=984307 RepID=UPI0030B8F739
MSGTRLTPSRRWSAFLCYSERHSARLLLQRTTTPSVRITEGNEWSIFPVWVMKSFVRTGLVARLYAISAALIVFLAAVAVVFWVQLAHVQELAKNAGEIRVHQLEYIASTELSVTQVMLDLRQAMLVTSKEGVDSARQDIVAMRQQISRNDDAFLANISNPAAKQSFRDVWLRMQADTWPQQEANLQLVADGHRDEAFAMLTAQTIPTFSHMQKWLAEERARQQEQLGREVADIGVSARSIRFVMVALVGVIAVCLVVFSSYIAGRLRNRIAASRQVAERVRDGDFTVPVVDSSNDEFSPLLGALDAMQRSLTNVVSSVRRDAQSVAVASAEISSGNVDLSSRTEEQAASLEETAASIVQLSETVQTNADHAMRANDLATDATAVVESGGQTVKVMVDTIAKISSSSGEIAQITDVIEGIAFQTNILALNAAVEAARAGEQGRGFAVVASEVRALAQRSATAAREIKTLIDGSVGLIGEGSNHASSVGSTMTQIHKAITQVSTIVGDIAAASRQQSLSFEQISKAVQQMDEVTQQNAALVEEAAAAAQSLEDQSARLRDAVSVFRVA